VQTLGCPKNEADSRDLERRLLAEGVPIVPDPDQCTHILLNTCGFIEDAKEESVNAILDACAHYPDRPVLAMGCLVQRYADELAEGIPEVAGWFGLVGEQMMEGLLRALGAGTTSSHGAGGAVPRRGSFAYLKISDGCDEPCTFCAIPEIKGSYYSVGREQILREADTCLSEGARELVLVGQDTTRWQDGDLDLCGLVGLLADDERVDWIRVMYLQPDGVTDAFLRFMAETPKLCRYLDMPFQHSHPQMLRAMARRGDGEKYLGLIEKARMLMPDVSVRSAFIVGFPGEQEEHLDHLLRFVDRAGFDNGGGFVYSPEEGTAAALLKPRVGKAQGRTRLRRLSGALVDGAERRHQQLIGSSVEVMIDEIRPQGADEDCSAVGRTRGQAPEVDGVTYLEGWLPRGASVGDVVSARVTATVGYDLVGTCDAA
jgi:ribosomal protein S12 methylthiotransferase